MKLCLSKVVLLALVLPSSALAFLGFGEPDLICEDKVLYIQTADAGRAKVGYRTMKLMTPEFRSLGLKVVPIEDTIEQSRKDNMPLPWKKHIPEVVFQKDVAVPCAQAIAKAIREQYFEIYQRDIGEIEVRRGNPYAPLLHKSILQIWWPTTDVNSYEN